MKYQYFSFIGDRFLKIGRNLRMQVSMMYGTAPMIEMILHEAIQCAKTLRRHWLKRSIRLWQQYFSLNSEASKYETSYTKDDYAFLKFLLKKVLAKTDSFWICFLYKSNFPFFFRQPIKKFLALRQLLSSTITDENYTSIESYTTTFFHKCLHSSINLRWTGSVW